MPESCRAEEYSRFRQLLLQDRMTFGNMSRDADPV